MRLAWVVPQRHIGLGAAEQSCRLTSAERDLPGGFAFGKCRPVQTPAADYEVDDLLVSG